MASAVVAFHRRARGALELAHVALEPVQPFENGPLDAHAFDLCAQATYWSLRGHRASVDASPAATEGKDALTNPGFETLWNQTDPALLVKAAHDDEAVVEELKRALLGKSFVDFASLSSDEAARLARELQGFAERLTKPLDSARVELESLRMRRLLRLAPLALVLIALAIGGFFSVEGGKRSSDLAHGKPWTSSSVYPAVACASPDQSCSGELGYFFHTGEQEDPWIVIDLGRKYYISSLHVSNRTDCCAERALPLIAEVSVKRGEWREVARRTEDFLNWRPAFSRVRARWIRLHVPRRSALHLARIRVFR